MKSKILNLIHLVVPTFILHLLEEIKTGFYQNDLSIKYISDCTNLTPEISFLLIEIVSFIFLGTLLLLIVYKKQIPLFLILVLNIILLYEFLHTYEAIKIRAYSSGLVTGTILGVLGILLLSTILKRHFSRK